MPLDATQADWLSQASGLPVTAAGAPPGTGGDDGKAKLKRKLADEEIADQERRTLLINDAMRLIDPMRPMLRQAFDLQLQSAKGGTKQFQAKDGDLGTSGEIRDLRSGDTVSRGGSKPTKKGSPPGEDPAKLIKEAKQAYQMITQLGADLLKETTTRSQLNPETAALFDGPAQPLFTTTEITDELYTPLIRARILPDTFVTGKFSKVQQMLDATNELYKQELVDAEDPNGGVAALAKGLIDLGSSLAEPILQAAGVDGKFAMTMVEGCAALAEASIDLGDKARAGLNVDSIKDFFVGLPGIIGPMVGSATGNRELGDAIGKAGSMGAGAIGLIVTSVKAKKPDVAGLIAFFSSTFSQGLGELKGQDDTGDALLTLGDSVQKLIAKAASKHYKTFFAAVSDGDARGARAACKAMCLDIAVSLPSLGSDIFSAATSQSELPDGVDDTVDTIQDTLDEVQDILSESNEATEELKKKLEGEADSKFAELENKVDKADQQRESDKDDTDALAESVKQELDQAKQEFMDQLKGLNDPTTADKTIMKLIVKIQKDRAVMSVAVAIGRGGFAVAEQFFAPLAMASEAIKMAANIAAAVDRAVNLRKFVDESVGAKNATSPYLTSIQNFVDNQANQLTHYAIAAALNGLKIAASAAATAYPLAAPAVPLVSAIQSAAEVVYTFYNANQVRKAWAVTKAALSDPKNRSLGLRARKVNPTLAKYSIAYGSVVERDPIAVHMANACGLDNETLKTKDANVIKVKVYLEVKFSDDNKVVGRFTEPPTWADDLPSPALEVAVVFRTFEVIGSSDLYKSVRASKPAVPPKDLVGLIRTFQKQTLPKPPTADALSERLSLAGRVVTSLRAQQLDLGSVHEDFAGAIEALVDVADNEQEKLAMELVRLRVAEAKSQPKQTGG